MTDKQYVTFEQNSYYQEGDQRSRDAPGHGYPGGYTNYTSPVFFKDIEEVKSYILRKSRNWSSKEVEVFKLELVKISLEVKLEVK